MVFASGILIQLLLKVVDIRILTNTDISNIQYVDLENSFERTQVTSVSSIFYVM